MRFFTEPSENVRENFIYPCGTCNRRVGKRMRAVQCDICNFWNHIKCDGVDPKYYEKLKTNPNIFHVCLICREELFPFQQLSNDDYTASIIHNINIDDNLNLEVLPSPIRNALFSDLNNCQNDEQSSINCEYYDYSKKIPNIGNKNTGIFHLNIASLGMHKDELEAALSLLDFEFDIIGITETKIKAGADPIFDPSLQGYNYYHTPTESTKGGALLYYKENTICKRREDLEKIMYKSKELESVFIEVLNEGKKNQIYACIYRHPCMDLEIFSEQYLSKVL